MELIPEGPVNRRHRLARSQDFERVRRSGKSYAHPLVVLISLRNQEKNSRFGVAAGRTLGNAVKRNRAKRRLRAALQTLLAQLEPGWDVVLIARQPLLLADQAQTVTAIRHLAQRAGLMAAPERS